MEGCFTKGRGLVFRWGDFIFKWEVRLTWGISFDGGCFRKKLYDGRAPSMPPTLWETLHRLLVFLNWVTYMQIYPLNACKLD